MKKDKNIIIHNKLLIKVVSYIVVLSLIISIFSINTYADDPVDATYLNTYAAHYFYYLSSNYGNNTEGTCGYVAAGMLLSFYDSYLNDNFIINDCGCDDGCNCDYDALGSVNVNTNDISSPGIKREEEWESYEDGYADYNAFIDDKADEFFHLKLLQIGRDELELYNSPTQNQGSSDSTTKPEDSPWEINISEVGGVIQAWLNKLSNDGEQGTIKNNVTIHISYSADNDNTNSKYPDVSIRNELIEKVKSGIPVVYFGYDEVGEEGHFMIAFDYDETNDTVYFHTGQGGNHIVSDKDTAGFVYTANTSILWFEIGDQLTHSHSSHYAYSNTSTTASLCACNMYSGSINHTHNYNAICNNDDWHFSRCVCGKITNIQPHTLSYSENNANRHKEKCTQCDYEKRASHEYDYVVYNDNTCHRRKCACGNFSSEYEDHYVYSYGKYNQAVHYTYCKCGYYTGTRAHVVSVNLFNVKYCIHCGERITNSNIITPMPGSGIQSETGITYITEAGSYVDANGVIYLVDSDMELYLAGQLDVYALAQNIGAVTE